MNKKIELMIKRTLYKKSFYEFLKAFWSYADPSVFQDNELLEYYCEVFQYKTRQWWNYQENKIELKDIEAGAEVIDVRGKQQHLNLVVPPRHSKSMVFNVFGAVWLWLSAPIKAVSVSHTGALASGMNAKRHSIINSPLFKELFPDIKITTNTTSYIKDNRGGELYSINRNAFTGYGGDIIINDDLVNAETARKDKEEMANAWSYYQNTLPSRINDVDKGVIINIQQRLAPNDITGHILRNEKLSAQYSFITLPAIFSKTTYLIFPISGKIKKFKKGEVLWKERFGDYKTLKYQVGASVFETQYLQNPIASDKTILKDYLIIEKAINEVPAVEEAEQIFAAHDFPIKDKESSDFAGSVLAYKVNNTIYIIDSIEKKMAFVKSIEYVKALNSKFEGIIQIIEDKANGSPIIQQLQDEVAGIQAYNPKSKSKTQRLESASLYMESKNVIFVKDVWNEEAQEWTLSNNLLNLKDRLLNFPFVKNDDIVDAFSMLVLYVFLDKRNSVYTRSFTNENISKITPEKQEEWNTNWFINSDNIYMKLSKIKKHWNKNLMFVEKEILLPYDMNKLKETADIENINFLIDVSSNPIYNFQGANFLIDYYDVKDFNKSILDLELSFSNKTILVNQECKRTISEITSFKRSIDNQENVRYTNENDGFIKNIRVARDFYGIYN